MFIEDLFLNNQNHLESISMLERLDQLSQKLACLCFEIMKKKSEKKINLTDDDILKKYRDPENPGSYGGVARFAKENGMSIARARKILQKGLGYTLHKPRRRTFQTLPVVVFGY